MCGEQTDGSQKQITINLIICELIVEIYHVMLSEAQRSGAKSKHLKITGLTVFPRPFDLFVPLRVT
jgi:hypothetical protein